MHTTQNRLHRGVLAGVVLLFTAVFGFATGTTEEVGERDEVTRRPIPELNHEHDVRASELLGTTVVLDDGTEAATVEDVIVDIAQGHLLYLVVSFTDDSYRASESLFPIPIRFFEPQDEAFVLYADNETYIENMPSLEQVDTYNPDRDDEWSRWMYSYWNTYPGVAVDATEENRLDEETLEDSAYREDRLWGYRYNYSSGPRVVPVAMLRGSELIGHEITTYDGDTAGMINDLVLNTENGQVLLVSMEPSSALAASATNYLVPLSAFSANRETTRIIFDNESLDLPDGVGFGRNWPELTDESLHDRVTEDWGEQGVGVQYGTGMQVLPVRLVSDTVIDNYDVFTRDSESIGEIEDLLIRQNGQIVYATFEYDEVWEIDWEDQTSVVPLSLLTIQPISQAAVMGVRAQDIDLLPKFEEGLVVDTSASNWDEAIQSYWNNLYAVERGEQSVGSIPTANSWAEVGSSDYLPASAIREFAVVDTNGEWIGEVEEIAIDMIRAEVGYLLLEVDESGLFADAEVAVPISAIRFNPEEEQLILDATRERLSNAPGYDEIPEDAGLDFLEEVRAFWEN